MGQGSETERTDVTPAGLVELARRKADESRHECRALTESLLGRRDAGLTDRQRATLSRLLRELVAETDAAIRWRLSAANEGAEWLAAPAPEGAGPTYQIMAESGAFDDGALVEEIAHRLYQHQLERAVRAPTRDAWPGDGGGAEHDLASVLGVAESGAAGRLIADYQVEGSGRTDSYGEPKLPARDLASELRSRLFWDCAAAVRETLADGDNAPEIDVAVEDAAREALAEFAENGETAASALLRALADDGLLSVELLVSALRAGEVTLFEAGLGVLAALEPRILRRLLYEPGGEGIAVLWRALRFPDALFDEVFALTRHARGRPLSDTSAALDHLRAFREGIPVENAQPVLGFWRLSPDYRAARRRVESRPRANAVRGRR